MIQLSMVINWFGQSCFRLEGKAVSLLIDPFSKEIGLRPPRIKDQIVLITHKHFDHANREGVGPETMVIDGPGEYERSGIYVHGLLSYHDKQQGAERGLNTIYTIKIEDMVICHLGDLGQEKLTEEQMDQLENIDVLLIPVGGKYTLDYKEAVGIISQIEPKIMVPMHYKVPGLTIDLDSADKFIKEIGLTPEKMDKLKITAKTLPTEEMKLVVFSL